MRKTFDPQIVLGEIEISQIKFDEKSRDDIPKVLKGLQYIYMNEKARNAIFKILERGISPNKSKKIGRRGMELWKILVMGVLRLNLNWDYDRLCDSVNNHKTIRQMLRHGILEKDKTYNLQTIKDNVSLLTSEMLDEINEIVVHCGLEFLGKDRLKARCDSFVVETNVHFPTDANLLFDAMRKIIVLTKRLCEKFNITGWRQGNHIVKKLKKYLFRLQKMKRSTSKNSDKIIKREKQIKFLYREYVDTAKDVIEKAKLSQINLLDIPEEIDSKFIEEIKKFIVHAERQIDQITRRAINDEVIPHKEKVFSVFEPHTRWISKGKAGVPVEFGLPVAIVEEESGFILNKFIMEKETDKDVAVPLLSDTKEKFHGLYCCSFDKGFFSKDNKRKLKEFLEIVALPKKGKLSKKEIEEQSSNGFRNGRKKHAAVESAINALESHGLDRCPDKGLNSFKRYVSLAILARNIQKLGVITEGKKRQEIDVNKNSKIAA